MSEETRQPITRTAASPDTGGLMSSIAAVREILMMNTASETKVISELQNIKQTSYRQKLHLEEELETQKALIKELRSKVTQGQEEVQREKTLRQALETAHTSLEEHKKELLSQLEKAINARLTLEAKLVAFRVDLEKENDEFEKERTKWEDLVRELRLQNEDTLKKSGELEARLLASQRQTKELDSSLAKLNKQVESTRVTRKATIQGYVNSNEKLRQLIELTNINSTGSMQERVEEAETARSVAVKKMGKSQMNIQTIKRGLSPEEIKKEKEPKDNIEEQLASLKSSLEKASQNLAEKQEAASKDSSKKQTLKKEIEEVGTILETMEQVYYQKLELAKSVADKASLDLARVREQWRHDKDDVTDVQANIQRCQSQLSKLKEVSPTATREFQEQSAAKKRGAVAGESSEKRQKQK